ncbi:MAG: hypothetical protein FJ284_07935 [Planctomycetes bacterium]|nr:hypothetical protein [Planctomycetota bacterium]
MADAVLVVSVIDTCRDRRRILISDISRLLVWHGSSPQRGLFVHCTSGVSGTGSSPATSLIGSTFT